MAAIATTAILLISVLSVGECVLPPLILQKQIPENDAVLKYFNAGYKYATIISILAAYHSIRISLSKLKRILRQHNLKRRQINVDQNELRNAIQDEKDATNVIEATTTRPRLYFNRKYLRRAVTVPGSTGYGVVCHLKPSNALSNAVLTLSASYYVPNASYPKGISKNVFILLEYRSIIGCA